MRPLKKPEMLAEAFGMHVDALLMNSLGEYCSFCEQPLQNEAYVWFKSSRSVVGQGFLVGPAEWHDLLLACLNCAEHGVKNRDSMKPMAYPDDEVTFSLRDASPLVYSPRDVTIVRLDRAGRPLVETQEKMVIVEAADPKAQSAIDLFQLNTRYYDPKSARLTIPHDDYMRRIDFRIQQRTRVYNHALVVVEKIVALGDSAASSFPSIRQAIAASGFWSTWATAIWQRTKNQTLLTNILMPSSANWITGATPDNVFPGTFTGVF